MARLLRSIAALGTALFLLTLPVGHAQQNPPADQTPVAQQPAQQPPPPTPTFRAGVNYVQVDVIVTDKNGNTVNDLKQEDFQVYEQGTLQKVDNFRIIDLDGGLIPK